MSRASATLLIVNERGLHARAAAALTKLAQRYPCEVTLRKDDQSANGKSIMGLLLLCGVKGTSVDVEADGPQAEEAVSAIRDLFANRFGEPQ